MLNKELTSAQRAALRSLANGLTPILHIGKEGVSDNVAAQLSDALEARELVKCTVQKNCAQDAREVCRELASALDAAEVQVIGRKFVLFRPSKNNPKIML